MAAPILNLCTKLGVGGQLYDLAVFPLLQSSYYPLKKRVIVPQI